MLSGDRGLVLVLALTACGGGAPPSAYLNVSAGANANARVRDMDPDRLTESGSSVRPGDMRLLPEDCAGFDTRPEYDRIGVAALAQFLTQQGLSVETTQARDDLSYLDVELRDKSALRLRVAVLDSRETAARDLHEAILEHGRGSWGVRRSNVAVLAPIGRVREIVDVAVDTRLACWGVLTLAGRDDVFVVPGGYLEL